MDSRIRVIDKIAILYRTGIKFLRGGYAESFLKKRMECFLWGKMYRLLMGNIFAVEGMLSLKISLRSMACVLRV